MRKWFIALLVATIMMIGSSVHAAGVTTVPKQGEFLIGVGGEILVGKDLKDGVLAASINGKKLGDIKTENNEIDGDSMYLSVSYGILSGDNLPVLDKLAITGKIGTSKSTVNGNVAIPFLPLTYEAETGNDLLWGAGVAAEKNLPEVLGLSGLKIVGGFEYANTSADIKSMKVGVYGISLDVSEIASYIPGVSYDGEIEREKYTTYVAIAKPFLLKNELTITPYVGASYIYEEVDIDNSVSISKINISLDSEIEAEDDIGLIAGAGFDYKDIFETSVDLSFKNEQNMAIMSVVSFKF